MSEKEGPPEPDFTTVLAPKAVFEEVIERWREFVQGSEFEAVPAPHMMGLPKEVEMPEWAPLVGSIRHERGISKALTIYLRERARELGYISFGEAVADTDENTKLLAFEAGYYCTIE